MSDPLDGLAGGTPLEPAEREGLLQTWITFRGELNEAEQTNISAGLAWVHRQARKDILNEGFMRNLHRRLFGDVWAWAGEFRSTPRDLGVEPALIRSEIRLTFDDTRYWIEKQTYQPDEIAVRLHHRLVLIHPFANGNGRTTRLIADLLAERLGREPFTWGPQGLDDIGETRARYIAALKAADDHDIEPLLEFARS